jgi:hypothetical protein
MTEQCLGDPGDSVGKAAGLHQEDRRLAEGALTAARLKGIILGQSSWSA